MDKNMSHFVLWHSNPSTLGKHQVHAFEEPEAYHHCAFKIWVWKLHQDLDPLQKPQVSPALKLSTELCHKSKSSKGLKPINPFHFISFCLSSQLPSPVGSFILLMFF